MSVDDKEQRAQLIDRFHGAVEDHEDVMVECLSILRMYNITPADLFFKYEAFVMSRPSGLRAKLSVLTLNSVRELKREIQREQQAQAIASSTSAMTGGSGMREGPGKTAGAGIKRGRHGQADLGGLLSELTGGSATPSRQNGSGSASLITPSSYATPSRPTNGGPSSSSYRPVINTSASTLQTPAGRSNGGTPLTSPVSADEGSPGPLADGPQSFRSRRDPHSLVETLNDHLPSVPVNRPSARPRVKLTLTEDPRDWDYRYMFEKVTERSASLDEQIDEFGDMIKNSWSLEELGDPHFVSDEAIYTVGRILAPPADSAKASTASMFLESSRLIGSGRRIALRFPPGEVIMRGGQPGAKTLGLFPGCLIAVKGKNGGGGFFAVEEVLVAQSAGLASTPSSELLDYQYGDKTQGEPVNLTVAAGPYSLDDDLEFEPLQALLEVAERERPDALILLGPFVDSHHPLIASGAITRSVSDIFKTQISARLSRFMTASPSTVIVLVPSIRDIISHHVVYPQAAFEKESFGLPKKVKLLPNPCTFSINEILISISTVDILFHLRREEVLQRVEPDPSTPSTQTPPTKDAMAGLVRHILEQRSFYPLFPVPESLAAEVNLDVTHQKMMKLQGAAPDLLILPSKLKHFSKTVDSTLVVNPAFICRSKTGGTFAKITVHPQKREMLEWDDGEDRELEHDIFERARAEIWKI